MADDAQSVADRLADLQKQIESLISERAGPAIAGARDQVTQATQQARDYACDGMGRLTGTVRQQPLLSLGVAGAIGYVLGRMLR